MRNRKIPLYTFIESWNNNGYCIIQINGVSVQVSHYLIAERKYFRGKINGEWTKPSNKFTTLLRELGSRLGI